MYGQGNFRPPYGHPLQLPPPSQVGSTDPQDSNPSYPAPENHSYSIPHGSKPYTQPFPQQLPPPPPRLPFPPQQQLYQSTNTLPSNFIPPPPPPQFRPLSANPSTIPIPMPVLPPPPPPLPPPPSLPPPPMPPPPPAVEPILSGGEVLYRESLDSATNFEKEGAGSVSPALSDMDMEDDDDVPASSKETNHPNREILEGSSLVNKESDVVKEVCYAYQSTIKGHVEEPLHVSQYITNELGNSADALVNACSRKTLPQTSEARGEGLMEDISPARSSLTPVDCVIDATTNSKPLEESTNLSPFQLIQQDYGSLDSTEDADDPASDKEMVNTHKNNVEHESKGLDGSELKEAGNVKRLRSKSLSESPRKRKKSPLTSSFPIQQTEMSPLGPHPPHFPSGDPGPISAQDPSQQMWPHLPPPPPPPPPPLAPHMQHVHTLHPTSDFTVNLVAPYPPVEPPQTFPLPFPTHAERWPQPSVSVSLHQLCSFPSSTSTGDVASSSTLLPSFTGSTITTRYNPYASTFETIPPPPVFNISSNLPGQGFSTDYGTKKGTAKHSASGTLYDPLSHSIEPIQKSNPLLVPDQFSSKPAIEPDVDEFGEEVVGAVENVTPEPVADPGPSGTGTVTGSKGRNNEESRSMKLLKAALADYVKEVLKPAWRQGNISKDAFKTIVKKTVDKVSASVPSHHIPKTPSKINQYVEASQQKVTKLVMSYVDKYVKKKL